MPETILEQILLSEKNLSQAGKQLRETKVIEEELKKRRSDGKLLYDGWRNTQDWHQWRAGQLERQRGRCASCEKQMKFGETLKLANGNFILKPDHPTVEHVLPKCYFPDLTLNKQNLVMTCWACNREKGYCIVEASRLRHHLLMQKLKQPLQQP